MRPGTTTRWHGKTVLGGILTDLRQRGVPLSDRSNFSTGTGGVRTHRGRPGRRTSLAVIAIVFVALVFPSAAQASSFERRSLDVPVTRQVVPLPQQVNGVLPPSCTWTRDGAALLCAFRMGEQDNGIQVGTIRPDGSGFHCLTCGTDLAGDPFKLQAFADGKRFLMGTIASAEETASSGASITPHIVDCAPSITDCQNLTVSDVALPTIPGDLNDREPRSLPTASTTCGRSCAPTAFTS